MSILGVHFPSEPGTSFRSRSPEAWPPIGLPLSADGLVSRQTMSFYVTGGLEVAELKYSETVAVVGNISGLGTFASSIRDTKAGWTAGAGVEWGFAPNWSAKFEYLYTLFDGVSAVATRVGALPPLTPNPTFTYATGDWTIQTARVGINYRWGGPVVAKYFFRV
jgi:outer membrane immunogenic protein